MLNWQPEIHAVGIAEMDATHKEFLQELARLNLCEDGEFIERFQALLAHTRLHFENENRLMQSCRFPAIGEHESEHRRILGELGQISRGVAAGRLGLARAYVSVGLPDWFNKHLVTMDSALAARLKTHSAGR